MPAPSSSGLGHHSFKVKAPVRLRLGPDAGVAQLVEHHLAKVGVAGSNPVSRFFNIGWRHSQAARQRSAKPQFRGANPRAAL